MSMTGLLRSSCTTRFSLRVTEPSGRDRGVAPDLGVVHQRLEIRQGVGRCSDSCRGSARLPSAPALKGVSGAIAAWEPRVVRRPRAPWPAICGGTAFAASGVVRRPAAAASPCSASWRSRCGCALTPAEGPDFRNCSRRAVSDGSPLSASFCSACSASARSVTGTDTHQRSARDRHEQENILDPAPVQPCLVGVERPQRVGGR